MISLENEYLKVGLNAKGAELIQLFSKNTELDYMWNADPNFWGKSSPVLFPIVGGLKNNFFEYAGKKYNLPRHGFARDFIFEVEQKTETMAVFLLKSTPATLIQYPFEFELRLIYSIEKSKLVVSYQVDNLDTKTMYFSVGGHPAFAVPIDKSLNYDDYYLAFNLIENLVKYPLNADGLTLAKPVSLENTTNKLPLSYALFKDDALVFKGLKSESITIKSDKSNHALKFEFKAFPYFGIWAAKNADFVCLEPWCGIADAENHNNKIIEKEGINKLDANEVFSRSWSVEVN